MAGSPPSTKKMDIVFIILCVVLIIILVSFKLINTVPHTDDLEKIFILLAKTDPTTRAYSLGYNDRTQKYRNVTVNQDQMIRIQEDLYPMHNDASLIVLQDHGTVTEAENGFKISGMDLVEFSCPPGYEGANCTSKPICSENDNGKIKTITYTEFNSLGLYNNTFHDDNNDLHRRRRRSIDDEIEPTHPRLRVHCLENGKYNIQACNDNQLLDESLNCQPYDVCEDRLNGFKHNYIIKSGDEALPENEYYVCENNISKKSKCSEDTVFSFESKGCITKSLCFGKGYSTLPIDEHNYIQCEHDVGTKIHCNEKVDDNNGLLSCHISLCKPNIFSYKDDMLEYNYGQIQCVNDKAIVTTCDESPNPRIYKYSWLEDFTYSIDQWPTQILNKTNGLCESPDTSIIHNPIIELAWSDAMPEKHKFNIITEEYVCDSEHKYRWDYRNLDTVPPTHGTFVETGTPCQIDPKVSLPDIKNLTLIKYAPARDDFMHMPALISVEADYSCWPIYSPEEKCYYMRRIVYANDKLTVTRYKLTSPPRGFTDSDEFAALNNTADPDGKCLKLVGFNGQLKTTAQYYTILTGKFDLIPLSDDAVPETEITFSAPKTIDLSLPGKYYIDWSRLSSKKITLFESVEISRGGIFVDTKKQATSSFRVLVVDIIAGEKNGKLKWGQTTIYSYEFIDELTITIPYVT